MAPIQKEKIHSQGAVTIAMKHIGRFHSRGPQPCEPIGTKETAYVGKSSTPKGYLWYTNLASVSLLLLLEHHYGRRYIKSRTNTLLCHVAACSGMVMNTCAGV